MDEQTLRWFVSLCRTENMRDTAALERIPQPTLSRALARLERDVGVTLFDRPGRSLRLNRFGRLLAEHAERMLAEADEARRRLRELTDPAGGAVRLGFLQSVGRWLVPRVIGEHRRRVPGARFELRQGSARDLFARLHDDALDVALATRPPAGEGLAWVRTDEQRLAVALPPGHRLAARARLGLADVAHEPLIAFSAATDLRGVVAGLFDAAGVVPTIAFESAEIDTMRGLVTAGLGLAVLPEPARPDAADPVYRPLVPRASRSLGVVWSTTTATTPAVEAFLDTVRSSAPGG